LRYLLPSLPGWPSTCVFLTVNEAQQYLGTSMLRSFRYLDAMLFGLICHVYCKVYSV
jgi:hypothetical protein